VCITVSKENYLKAIAEGNPVASRRNDQDIVGAPATVKPGAYSGCA
jgi:hypothetical protein